MAMVEDRLEVPQEKPVRYNELLAPSSNGVVIRLQGVTKTLGGRKVLDNVSLEVHRGETVAIIGGSGAGKSVTLKHIVGLMKPDAGTVTLENVDVSSASAERVEEVRKKIGFVFQNGALLGSVTVYENVALPLREHERLAESEVRRRVEKALALVGLSDAIDKMPSNLSGGMRKRASLARAIIRQPEIILYDEPTSGLDPVMSSIIDDLIVKAREELGVTSIIVTHDMSSVRHVANRVAMLYRGAIYKDAMVDDFMRCEDPLIQQFIKGDPEGPLTEDYARGKR
jgi:phospholipid/cholesterol/gamma-HCH transport system ATP-binding protein